MRSMLMAVVVFAAPVDAATIYLCKAYSGGMFCSSALCSTQKASIDRTASVPDGMPFNQQVELAEQQRNEAQKLYAQPAQQTNTSGLSCSQLSSERRALDQITEKMIWVPIETQNANYHRINQIKADMARRGCRY